MWDLQGVFIGKVASLSFCWLYFGREILTVLGIQPKTFWLQPEDFWRTSLYYLVWDHCFREAISAGHCMLQLWCHDRITVVSRGEHLTWSWFYKQEKCIKKKEGKEEHTFVLCTSEYFIWEWWGELACLPSWGECCSLAGCVVLLGPE